MTKSLASFLPTSISRTLRLFIIRHHHDQGVLETCLNIRLPLLVGAMNCCFEYRWHRRRVIEQRRRKIF